MWGGGCAESRKDALLASWLYQAGWWVGRWVGVSLRESAGRKAAFWGSWAPAEKRKPAGVPFKILESVLPCPFLHPDGVPSVPGEVCAPEAGVPATLPLSQNSTRAQALRAQCLPFPSPNCWNKRISSHGDEAPPQLHACLTPGPCQVWRSLPAQSLGSLEVPGNQPESPCKVMCCLLGLNLSKCTLP